MFKNFSLRKKIILSIVGSALFLCILTSLATYFYLSKILVDNKIQSINRISAEQIDQNVQILKNNQTFSKMLSDMVEMKDYLSKPTEAKGKNLTNILSGFAKEDSKYINIYLLDTKGAAVISVDPLFISKDYSFRDYYKQGMLGKPYVDLLLGKTRTQFGYYFSYPVFDDNKKVLGVFVLKTGNEEVDSVMLSSELNKDSVTMITDEYGVVIYSSKPERFLKSLGPLNAEEQKTIADSQKFLNNEILPLQYDVAEESLRNNQALDNASMFDSEDKDKELINLKKIGDFPFYLFTETDLGAIDDQVLGVVSILAGLILCGVLIAGSILYKLISVFISPLNKLKDFAYDISTGNYDKKIDLHSGDEIGDLAKIFNHMGDSLRAERINLEHRVASRTKELETLNKYMVGRELKMVELKRQINNSENNKNNFS